MGLAGSTSATRARLAIRIPAFHAAAYVAPVYRYGDGAATLVPAYLLPAHPRPQCRYYRSMIAADLYAVDIDQPDPDQPGTLLSVGQLPDTRISMLAFGSVPVTATLHVRQAVQDGKLVRLTAGTVVSYISTAADDPGGPNGVSGCDPNWESPSDPATSTQPPFPTHSVGLLDVSLSDVSVDGKPLDVGADCGTASPLRVNLLGEPPACANVYLGGTLVERLDRSTTDNAGSVYPLYAGSTNLTIPAFRGCRNPATGESLDALVTAMVSGPDNTPAVDQSQVVFNNLSNSNISLCGVPGDGQGCSVLPDNPEPPAPGHQARSRHTR